MYELPAINPHPTMPPRRPAVNVIAPFAIVLPALLAALGCGGSGTDSANPFGNAGSSSSGGGGSSQGAGCGDGQVGPGEQCDDGNDNRFDGCLPECTLVEPLNPPDLTWTKYEIPETKCRDGQPAGFGISVNPTSKKLMIYLEGGGACFNELCDFTAYDIPFIPPPDGIFDRVNPVNPVADWNMIYVPYCTGDVWAGDKDTVLGGQVRHFHGYRNIAKYLELWVPTFPGVDTVLVTGISAGGFGSGINAPQIADAFGSGRQMVLIDDSGMPFSNKVVPPCLQDQMRGVWGLEQTILAHCGQDCPDPTDFASGLLNHLTSAYPAMRKGLFSFTADAVMAGYFGFGWGDFQYNHCSGMPTSVPAAVFTDGLLAMRNQYKDRISTFYPVGTWHTALRSPTFSTVTAGDISNGMLVTVAQWAGHVINGDIQHVGP